MRRIVAFFLIITLCLSLFSCTAEPDSFEMLKDFIKAYGASGVIYSPHIPEGREGYIPKGFIEKIYVFSGDFPDEYAVFLNSRPEYGYECALFICSDAATLDMMEEASLERIALLDGRGERSFVKRTSNSIFYSTMKDKKRAEALWREMIR